MLRMILSLTLVSLTVFASSAQMRSTAFYTCAYGEGNQAWERCKNYQADLAYADTEAGKAVDKILKKIGMSSQRRLVLIPCPGIQGALAGMDEHKNRIIWYDNAFMADLNKRANADSPSWVILSHEVAHHLYAHPLSQADPAQSREDELAADRFAGFILFKLGVPLEQAQDTLKAFPDVQDERFAKHPKHERRIKEMAEGYREAAAEQSGNVAPSYSYVLRGTIQYYPCGSNTLTTHKVDRIITEPYLWKFDKLYGRFVDLSVEATQLTNGKPCASGIMGVSPHQHMHVPGLPDDPDLLSVGDRGKPGPYFKGGWMGKPRPKDPSGCMDIEIGFEPSTACDGR